MKSGLMGGFLGCFLAALIYGGILALVVGVFTAAWNYTVPALFHGPRVAPLQVLAMMFLLGIISSYFRSDKGDK